MIRSRYEDDEWDDPPPTGVDRPGSFLPNKIRKQINREKLEVFEKVRKNIKSRMAIAKIIEICKPIIDKVVVEVSTEQIAAIRQELDKVEKIMGYK